MLFKGKTNSFWSIPELDEEWNFKQTHVQYVDHIKKYCDIKRNVSDGFTDAREFRHKARIPAITFAKIAHIIAPNGLIDDKALDKWLDSDEGRAYKITRGSAKNA